MKENSHKGVMSVGIIVLVIVLLFAINLLLGAADIPVKDVVSILLGSEDTAHPSWNYIILQNRLPQALTAMLCGASLAVSGLMLQTAFRNPLAGILAYRFCCSSCGSLCWCNGCDGAHNVLFYDSEK